MDTASNHTFLPVRDYDLALTLTSGQSFRWRRCDAGWEGIISGRWVRLAVCENGLRAEAAVPVVDWTWLRDYLQTDLDFKAVLRSFPDDEPMRASVAALQGLRLLRQEPWECLASFILSSTKQIVQIQQIIGALCRRFGEPVTVPPGHNAEFSFPTPERLAEAMESELRACKMGFRAPHLLAAARQVAHGHLDLECLRRLSVDEARADLLHLRGVGEKIANCVLLFAYGSQSAFPVDVWIMKALRQLYFPRRRPSAERLRQFTSTHFGPWAGYAQQYLFCYMRAQAGRGIKPRNSESRCQIPNPRTSPVRPAPC